MAGNPADEIWARLEILKNIQFSTLFSQGIALFQCFFRQTPLQSCFIESEILQSPMISYQSL